MSDIFIISQRDTTIVIEKPEHKDIKNTGMSCIKVKNISDGTQVTKRKKGRFGLCGAKTIFGK